MTQPLNEFSEALWSRRIEPQQRLVGGVFTWATHRFPIKGGISMVDVIAYQMKETNALYRQIRRKLDEPS